MVYGLLFSSNKVDAHVGEPDRNLIAAKFPKESDSAQVGSV
jgi:hypothetical protein